MRRFAAFAALFVLVLLGAGGVAHADVNNFTITDFTANETLSRADPQGELHVIEHISVDFAGDNHGIERAIPTSYHGNSLHFHLNKISSASGAPVQVSTRRTNGNVVLRIGDPARTVTGPQEYTIDYTLQNVITFYKDHDELYWDVNGDQWQQPTSQVRVTLLLPKGASQWSQPVCYAGNYGDQAQQCLIQTTGNRVQSSASLLSPKQTLTYVIGFQKGFFTPMSVWDKVADHIWTVMGLAGPPLLALAIGGTWWWKRGRDAKGRGTIVPEYTPPEGLTPLEAGTVVDFTADNRDLTATIIDLARRGYLRIIETKKDRKILKDALSYSIQLINPDAAALNNFEAGLMSALFVPYERDVTTELGTYNGSLSKAATQIRKDVSRALTKKGYFKTDPTRLAFPLLSLWLVVWFGIVFASGAHVLGLWPIVGGVIIGAVIFGTFVHHLSARTAKGVAAREQLLGLKMYMETAEKDRLEKLEGPNAAYASRTREPARTVEFFESLLPYAIVLGVETQWAAQFKGIYQSPPDWYAGNNLAAFNVGYLAGALSGGVTAAMDSSFGVSSSSSSSGFSGGGFSGGGGGGGGGGGW
jgi:uncharacterized membrane protein YgcG